MTARVHDADGLAAKLRRYFRLERYVDLFRHRQCIHVRAQRDGRTRQRTLQHGRDAGETDTCFDFEAELPKSLRDDLRRAGLAIAQFRVLVKVAALRDDSRLNSLRGGIEY